MKPCDCRIVIAFLLGLAGPLVGGARAAGPSTSASARHSGEPDFETAYQAPKWMQQAVRSPDYDKAAAHQPRFDDKNLWSHLDGGEGYVKQAWAKGRLLVWARPGTGGGEGQELAKGALDAQDPKNWLENGKPATSGKFDENTDLLLPASRTPYRVGVYGPVRHVTVEAGASWHALGAFGGNMTVHGNVWIKRGGRVYVAGNTTLAGSSHVFYRNDDESGVRCSQHFQINKQSGATAEMLGHISMLDEFTVFEGAAVVGPDSKLQPGRNANPTVRAAGTLALMDGAVFAKWQNDWTQRDLEVFGAVQGGLPDRPLKRNCTLDLHFKNYTGAKWNGPSITRKDMPDYRVPSMIVRAGGMLRSYSTDVRQAKLVVTFSGLASCKYRPPQGSAEEKKVLDNDPGIAQFHKWFDALPRKIDVWFGAGACVDGVEFDYLRKGGLMFVDAGDRAKLKNVSFGPHCDAAGDASYATVSAVDKSGRY